MRELKIIDVENSTLIVAHPDGEEFRVSLDDASLARLRVARSTAETVRVSPKDVQAHIRAGMSAEEVAALTGASLDFIARFEGPVLAEREFIINSALGVETQATIDLDTGETSSAFGALIHSRLRDLDASGERWASWKEADGSWVVKLEFDAADIGHDARWVFEPRKHALSPLNSDAATLSQKGDMSTGIIPRLRAVPGDPSSSSGEALATVSRLEFAVTSEDFTYETNAFVEMADLFSTGSIQTRTATENATGTSPTADLLEALRRRRGENEITPAWLREELTTAKISDPDESSPQGTTPQGTTPQGTTPQGTTPQGTTPQPLFTEPATGDGVQRTGSHARRERTSMPSWDEIVFGTRSDDDDQ